jgi:hypothetical protein
MNMVRRYRGSLSNFLTEFYRKVTKMADRAPRLMRVLEISVSDADDFLIALAIGLVSTAVAPDPPVAEAILEPVPVLVELDSWNRTWGEFSGVADDDVMLTVDEVNRETV